MVGPGGGRKVNAFSLNINSGCTQRTCVADTIRGFFPPPGVQVEFLKRIELLKGFMNIENVSGRHQGWVVGIHLVFFVSGRLSALMDRIHGKEAVH